MSSYSKPTLEQVRADLREGLDREAVRKKYGLSGQETEALFKQLLQSTFKLDAGAGAAVNEAPSASEAEYSPWKDPKALMFGKWGAAGVPWE